MTRIPITMCHGVDPSRKQPLTLDRFETYFRMAADMGFTSISYDDLEAWFSGRKPLPTRPIMFDVDHPEKSVYHDLWPLMRDHGFKGNVFVNTGQMEKMYATGKMDLDSRTSMTWDELGELAAAGWQIGAHTHSHPNICDLCMADSSGDRIRWELDTCNACIQKNLGIIARDFAYIGETWHSQAEAEVKRRYRFARLWITGQVYWADGELVKFQDLAGMPGTDEADGGPPIASRYITKASNPYRLPSMELGYFIYQYDAYKRYLEGALET
ncbi:MAG: polysaccharide deacetylase family protein [Lentisphaerae bacterium]|nr:polysaccharide deacetylase family protein [Lentisphaerota bacterium]